MSARGFRDSLADIVPVWLSNRPGLNNGYKWLFTMAAMLDAFTEGSKQGVEAAWPGRGTPTADPYISVTRQLVQGESEMQAAFESRLRAWLEIWTAGTPTWPNRAALAQRIHEYLGNNPTVSVVSRGFMGASDWVTVSAAGVITYNDAGPPLHWDDGAGFGGNAAANSPTTPWWGDLWIIVSPPEWAPETRSLTAIAAAYGTFANWAATGLGIGHACPRLAVDTIAGLIRQWKGAHTNIRGIVWNYTPTDFNPNVPASIPCDGYWGPWAAMPTGTAAVPHRKASDRFWELPESLSTNGLSAP